MTLADLILDLLLVAIVLILAVEVWIKQIRPTELGRKAQLTFVRTELLGTLAGARLAGIENARQEIAGDE